LPSDLRSAVVLSSHRPPLRSMVVLSMTCGAYLAVCMLDFLGIVPPISSLSSYLPLRLPPFRSLPNAFLSPAMSGDFGCPGRRAMHGSTLSLHPSYALEMIWSDLGIFLCCFLPFAFPLPDDEHRFLQFRRQQWVCFPWIYSIPLSLVCAWVAWSDSMLFCALFSHPHMLFFVDELQFLQFHPLW
jgi:hypothetical protein